MFGSIYFINMLNFSNLVIMIMQIVIGTMVYTLMSLVLRDEFIFKIIEIMKGKIRSGART